MISPKLLKIQKGAAKASKGESQIPLDIKFSITYDKNNESSDASESESIRGDVTKNQRTFSNKFSE